MKMLECRVKDQKGADNYNQEMRQERVEVETKVEL
jgi:hypothetical protein